MEVRIGVRNVAREITLESAASAETVAEAVAKAVTAGSGVLTLEDEKGRQVIVPVDALGYVDIGATERGQVGFGAR